MFAGIPLHAQILFQCSTPSVVLGSFSATDPSDNFWTAGNTQFVLQSEVPWELVGRLTQPVRRVSDGLELPMERVRSLFPDVGEEFAGFLPFRIDYGQGIVMENQFVEFGWEVLQLRVADFVEAGDPPGVYRAPLEFQVRDRAGVTLSNIETILFEFEILPWIEVELPQPGLQLIVNDQHSPAESEPLLVVVRSNAGCDLRLTWSGDLLDLNNGELISARFVEWRIESGAVYQTLLPDFQPVALEAILAVVVDDPEPFMLVDLEIPLVIRCDALGLTGGGNYGADLTFDVTIREDAR